jgi:hypothetical protein
MLPSLASEPTSVSRNSMLRMRTVPVNRSADLLVDGYELQGLISVAALRAQSNRPEIDVLLMKIACVRCS